MLSPLATTAKQPGSDPLVIRLFGPFEALRNNQPLSDLRLRSGASLLAFLALHHDQAIRATSLAQTFWTEQAMVDGEIEKALASLRQSIRQLRQTLADDGERIETTNGAVVLRTDGAHIDTLAFEQALLQAQGDRASLDRAVALYRGALLEGWNETWVVRPRERYRDLYVNALRQLAEQAIAEQDATAAARYLRRLVIEMPGRESGWQQLMEVLAQGGERLEAMTVYLRYRDYLYKRGGLEPPAEMTALYQRLQERPAHVAMELLPDFAGYEPVGGAVPLRSPFYTQRPADAEFNAAIARRDSIVLVKGPRQIGKTSLLVRGLDRARQAGARLILTDLQKLAEADFEGAETFFLALAQLISDQLELDISPRQTWNPERAPGANFERFLRRAVLNQADAPVVWGLDEVDRLFPYPYRNDVFGLFRAWYNERSFDPTGPLGRLTLVMAYATEAHLFITDLNQSPFNVGARLVLDDLTAEQVVDLNTRYGAPLADQEQIERLLALVGGHPYLVRRALHQMRARGLDIAAIEAQAARDDGLFGDHLERMLLALRQDGALMEVVRSVLRGQGCPSTESFYRLRSAGVMTGDTPADLQPRCRLYALYLTRRLL
jgi:DNA-binding SARP family transcriptional activator